MKLIDKIKSSLNDLVVEFERYIDNGGQVVVIDKDTEEKRFVEDVENVKSRIHEKKREIETILLSEEVGLLFESLETNQFYFKSKSDEFLSEIDRITEITKSRFTVHSTREINFVELKNFLQEIYDSYRSLFETYKNFNLFSEVLRDSRSVCIIGPNGVGKSTLVDDLKKDQLFKIYAIPAQKWLYYYSKFDKRTLLEKSNDIFLGQEFKNSGKENQYGLRDEKTELFTHTLDTLLREHQMSKSDLKEPRQSLLDKVNEIYSCIFPYLTIETNSEKSILEVENSNSQSKYTINSLSDGEKSVLFYTAAVLMAVEDTFFVIDEPETHINLALSVKMWDLLINNRKDCKFIFISHDSQFIQSRISNDILWCKEYKDRTTNKLQRLDDRESSLREVLIKISGTRQPIMFCEGNYDSLDYKLLSILYSDDYLVKPVGGHRQVIDYTRAIKRSELFQEEVIGIIDADFHSDNELRDYWNEGIKSLPVNEIEMLYLHQNVIEAVFENVPLDPRPTFYDAKKRIREALKSSVEKMASIYIKYYIESNIFAMHEPKTKAEIEDICGSLVSKLDLESVIGIYEERLSKLNEVFESEDYLGWLKYSTLKGELVRGILNQMENNFQGRALIEIQKNMALQSTLKEWLNIERTTYENRR